MDELATIPPMWWRQVHLFSQNNKNEETNSMDWLEEIDVDLIHLLNWSDDSSLEETDLDSIYSLPVTEVQDSINPLPSSAGQSIISASPVLRHASMTFTAPTSSISSTAMSSMTLSMKEEDGEEDKVASMLSYSLESLSQGEVSIPPQPPPPPPPRRQTGSHPITTPSCFDVVGGRGRGILQLPGYRMYRALVSMNKRIYARCHQHDKGKVSKGIVAAIRESGGRFLEYDKESKTYHDMGDKKATAKRIRQRFSRVPRCHTGPTPREEIL